MSLLTSRKSKERPVNRSTSASPPMTVISSAQPSLIKFKVYSPNTKISEKPIDPSLSKRFCIDPRIVSFRTIHFLIRQAFDIKSEFTISSVEVCPKTDCVISIPIWSDWELDTAIKNVKKGSNLKLRYDLLNPEDGFEDWDFVGFSDVDSNIRCFNVDPRSVIATENQQNAKPPSVFDRAINWINGGHNRKSAKPLTENDLKNFFDDEGRLVNGNGLRQAIYEGGIESSCRKHVWMHLLNVFTTDMTSADRKTYLDDVSTEYERLKSRWNSEQSQNKQIQDLMSNIHKDVLRTDRTFAFYAASSENNVRLQSLFNVLMTFCTANPNVPYCQGMNEYASVFVYVMRNESLAYLCFCSIMRRIRTNFSPDGVSMETKFDYLRILLKAIDPVFWELLESCDAVNLLFTYRWLLLECKREFPFHDALRVLEVMWATLPIENELPSLSEFSYLSEMKRFRCVSFVPHSSLANSRRRANSCPMLIVSLENEGKRIHSASLTYQNLEQFTSSLNTELSQTMKNMEYRSPEKTNGQRQDSTSASSKSRERSCENSFPLSELSEFDSKNLAKKETENQQTRYNPRDLSTLMTDWLENLTPEREIWLEEENSFLLFLCVSIILAHRNHLLKQKNLDEHEISAYFDRHRRTHRAERLLPCAKSLHSQYIQWSRKKRIVDDLNRLSAS